MAGRRISQLIEQFRGQPELPRFYGQQQVNNGPWGQDLIITPASTVGLNRLIPSESIIELDVTPLQRFINKILPFVIEVSYLKVNVLSYSDGRTVMNNPRVKLIVTPTHRAELYDEDIEDKVKAHIRSNLLPLLVSMYNISDGFGLEIHFGSKRSETILEYLKDE